ncbi:MAG: PilN domain-containing protein [Gammaproteobacteria bacterium]
MSHSNSSFLNWWFQGLSFLIPQTLKDLFSPVKKRILLQFKDEQLAVIWPNQKTNSQIDYYSIQQTNDLKSLLKRLSKFDKEKHDISLCIPSNKGLKKTLKLPLSAEADLSHIMEFEIDRQTPFRREDVYSGHRLVKRNPETNTLDAELNVVPKKSVDPQLAKLDKIGVIPTRVELQNNGADYGINIHEKVAPEEEHKTTRYINFALLLLMFLLGLITLVLPFKHLDNALKNTEQEIEVSRKEALEINNLKAVWEKSLQKQNLISDKINSRESITVILDELTKIIPDNSWLNRLQLRADTIKLHGESATATDLIGLIEQSDYFSDARFQSPVTNNVSTGNDRFQITAKITYSEFDKNDQQVSQ